MPPITPTLLIFAMLAIGGWLTLAGTVLLGDVALTLRLRRMRAALGMIRQAAAMIVIGLLLFGAGAIGCAQMMML